MPIYQKIALDLANKIYTGNIAEGSTLYGRSVLAGKYNVSPETTIAKPNFKRFKDEYRELQF